ncbi:HNH endonuclease signature motif containing protein [Aspergillus lucknowensis]|uniref:HNH nuclease domain-containing protein n=1 Tax=Aspergillus lucknowensis TaxID=176173 RepID=A0ABR4LRK5_9EURO
MSAFDDLPPLIIPKKRRAEEIESLRKEVEEVERQKENAHKRCKPHGGFNAEYWAAATEVEEAIVRKASLMSEICLSEYKGSAADWERTEEARNLFETMRVHGRRVASYSKHREELSLSKPQRPLRAAFMKFWTSSKSGLGIITRAGPRNSKMQLDFREEMLRDYESLDEHGNAWCPVLGGYLSPQLVTASHLFPYKAGQDAMDAIFGRIRPAELFSSRNGLILSAAVEKCFDSGVIVIVPDLPERPTKSMLECWVNKEVRDYKLRIIDRTWAHMEHFVDGKRKWKDLDGKKLEFKGSFRPEARYVYFHYCQQILRRSWRAGPSRAALSLQDEIGKPFWGTPGKYIRKNMLRALMEEVGHEADDLLLGAKGSGGDSELLTNVVADQVVAQRKEEEKEDEDDDSEEADELDDWEEC